MVLSKFTLRKLGETMTRKRMYISIGTIALLAFLIYFFTPSTSKTYPSLKDKSYVTLKDKEEVREFYRSHTPGLKRAEELGLVKDINQKIEFEGFKKSITLDRIWYNKEEVHLFYNRDVNSVGQEEYGGRKIEKPNIKALKFDKKRSELSYSIVPTLYPKYGVQYKGRYYSRFSFTLRDEENYDHITEINQKAPIKLELNVDGEVKTFTTKIPMEYDSSHEKIQSFPVDKTYSYKERSIHFTSLEIGTSQTRLHFTVEHPPKHIFHNLSMRLNKGNGESKRVSHTVENKKTSAKNDFYMEFDPLNEIPENISMQFKHATFLGLESLNFQVDFSSRYANYNKEELEMDKKLTSLLNTDVMLDRLYLEGTEDNPRVSVFIHYDYQEKNPPYITLSTDSRVDDSFNPKFPSPMAKAYLKEDEPLHYGGGGGYGKEDAYSIAWGTRNQSLDTPLQVKIDRLAYQVNFEKPLEIQLEQE